MVGVFFVEKSEFLTPAIFLGDWSSAGGFPLRRRCRVRSVVHRISILVHRLGVWVPGGGALGCGGGWGRLQEVCGWRVMGFHKKD